MLQAPGDGLVERTGLPVLRWPLLDGLPVDAVATTRHGGTSAGPYASLNLGLHVGDEPTSVLANRRRAARAIGCELDDLVWCRQVHGREVVVVDRQHRGAGATDAATAVADADAMVTTDPAVGLAILVADCVPIALVDPDAGVLGCAHAGWRGTVADVVGATVAAMVAAGASPDRVRAVLGPAIAGDRYEVGPEVAEAVAAQAHLAGAGALHPNERGRWTFDLVAANVALLLAAGLRVEHVATSPHATGEGTPFFSHRAEQPCGRFAVLARLRP